MNRMYLMVACFATFQKHMQARVNLDLSVRPNLSKIGQQEQRLGRSKPNEKCLSR